MAELSRARYAALYGPTVGDRVRLADTDLLIEVTEDRCGGPGRSPATRRCSAAARSSASRWARPIATRAEGTPDLVITGVVVLDHWGVIKADVGVRDGRIVALGKAGNPDTMDGVTPGAGDRPVDGDHRRQRHDPDRRRHRQPRPPDRAAADPGRAGRRHHDADRRRHRPGRGHQGHDRDAGRVLARRDAARDHGVAGQRRPARQGQHGLGRGAVGAAARRRRRVQAARGLGHHAGRDRRLPDRGAGTPACRSPSTPTR